MKGIYGGTTFIYNKSQDLPIEVQVKMEEDEVGAVMTKSGVVQTIKGMKNGK